MQFVQKGNAAGVPLENWEALQALTDISGRTALRYLVQSHKPNCAKLVEDLIEASNVTEFIDLNKATNSDVTELMLACKSGNSKMVQALINGRASPFLKDQLSNEAINYCVTEIHDQSTKNFADMINVAKEQCKTQVTQ